MLNYFFRFRFFHIFSVLRFIISGGVGLKKVLSDFQKKNQAVLVYCYYVEKRYGLISKHFFSFPLFTSFFIYIIFRVVLSVIPRLFVFFFFTLWIYSSLSVFGCQLKLHCLVYILIFLSPPYQ